MRSKEELKLLMEKVNDYYIKENPDCGTNQWDDSVYYLGCHAAYEILGKKEYLDYMLKWADKNDWTFFYDPNHEYLTFYDYTVSSDSQLCAETYMKLWDKGYGTDKNVLKLMDMVLNDERCDYWWWIDAIHMGLPFYYMMAERYGDKRYSDKVYGLYTDTKTVRGLYDTEEKLWYRDANFFPDKMLTKEGKKLFWSRGNGWVFGGLARTLDFISEDNEHYEEYKKVFCDMAEKLRDIQCEDGFWHTSLLAPEDYDMPETSGTTLYLFGMLVGMRLGLLDKSYLDCVIKGFEAVTNEALTENGRICWCQGINDRPGVVDKNETKNYVVGIYLLILKELLEL